MTQCAPWVPLLLLLPLLVPSLLPVVVARNPAHIADPQDALDTGRLRHALRALLDLSNAELQLLMSGAPPQELAPRLQPSTAFFLASSRQQLERLSQLLAWQRDQAPPATEEHTRLANRRKKWRAPARRPPAPPSSAPDNIPSTNSLSDEGPDRVLDALTELSSYLSGGETTGQARGRRSYRSHGRHHSVAQARQLHSHHYLYYMRSTECPRAPDGRPKLHCPTPTEEGKWECVDEYELCDGEVQCPGGEDEAPTHCLFHKAMQGHMDELTKYVLMSKMT